MNIAVIGWGSLIWCPGSLRIRTKWRVGGPMLPIEFARISDDGRLTLVIHPSSAPQLTYWALSEITELASARRNLMEREGCLSLGAIHHFPLDNANPSIPPEVETELGKWLPTQPGIQAVIWTGLKTNWSERGRAEFSPEDAVRYLAELDAQRRQTRATYDRAKEYVRNAPPSVQTKVRQLLHQEGWTDVKLSESLFEAKD
jgi:hypothetical protein